MILSVLVLKELKIKLPFLKYVYRQIKKIQTSACFAFAHNN